MLKFNVKTSVNTSALFDFRPGENKYYCGEKQLDSTNPSTFFISFLTKEFVEKIRSTPTSYGEHHRDVRIEILDVPAFDVNIGINWDVDWGNPNEFNILLISKITKEYEGAFDVINKKRGEIIKLTFDNVDLYTSRKDLADFGPFFEVRPSKVEVVKDGYLKDIPILIKGQNEDFDDGKVYASNLGSLQPLFKQLKEGYKKPNKGITIEIDSPQILSMIANIQGS